MSDPIYTIAKFEKIETPQVAIFFTCQKTPESRKYLLQAYVPLTGNESCTDEELCDIAWESVKDKAAQYLAEETAPPPEQHPLMHTEYTPKTGL
jgi:hypothetical protein